MAGSEDVMQLLWIGITVEVVGSILAALLWKIIATAVERFRSAPQPLLPLVTAVEEPTDETGGVEMETLNANEG